MQKIENMDELRASSLLALVKFFRNEDYLQDLVGGRFYCQPPERYRLEHLEGVGDPHESCSFSYREERGDPSIQVKLNDIDISDVNAITIHRSSDHDSWLHCWMSIRLPNDEESLAALKADVKRMKKEFGDKYVFIPAPRLRPFVDYLKTQAPLSMWCGEVLYASTPELWSSRCKAVRYSYQREYRFCFGECSTSELAPLDFRCSTALERFIVKDANLTLKSKDDLVTWFDLQAI